MYNIHKFCVNALKVFSYMVSNFLQFFFFKLQKLQLHIRKSQAT